MGPLKFRPILRRIRWGGRRLATRLGKSLGPESDYAESWELCDHGDDQSVVQGGELDGWTLHRLVAERGRELLGIHAGISQFPLLLKFLDAHDRLSVQVHPDDEQARRYSPGENGKTEAWVILAANRDGCIYAGLNPGIGRRELQEAIVHGGVEQCLHRVPVAPGDCLFIPAGTVHAIGEGVLLAEVQQSSDVTFRLDDWGRVGTDGKPRPLHIAESLACIDFGRGPVDPVTPRLLQGEPGSKREELVRCSYFVIERHSARDVIQISPEDRCVALMGLAGKGVISTAEGAADIGIGETALVPASTGSFRITPDGLLNVLSVVWDG